MKFKNQQRKISNGHDEVPILITEKHCMWDQVEHVISESFAIAESVNLQQKHSLVILSLIEQNLKSSKEK